MIRHVMFLCAGIKGVFHLSSTPVMCICIMYMCTLIERKCIEKNLYIQ